MDQPFYILSNASLDVFPNNTLSEFKNVLPKKLTLPEDEKWEVGVETVGISSMFRNIKTPPSGVPVIFAGHNKTKMSEVRTAPVSDEVMDWHYSLNFDLKKGGMMYTEMVDKYYTKADVYSMCRLYNVKLGPYCRLDYDGGNITISYQDKYNVNSPGTWIFLHELFAESFKLNSVDVKKVLVTPIKPANNSNEVRLVEVGGNLHIQRKVVVNDQVYLGYLLTRDETKPYHGPLVSCRIDLNHHDYLPEIIKVQCDIIEPQILNNTYSQDLLVLSTDVQYTNNYYYHDIERVSYFPLLFNDIGEIKIKLVDENDKLLQLVKGHASIIKLRFRKNNKMTKNFYVRLTSKPSDIFPGNLVTKFSVQLPSTQILDENWKVSLNSINIPNKFTTFLSNHSDLRSFVYKTGTAPSIKHVFKTTECYTQNSLLAELNVFLVTNNIGDAKMDSLGRLVINVLDTSCTLGVGLDAAKVLGYETGLIPKNSRHMFIKPLPDNPNTITFESPINVYYFRPNYFIVYSNIVQPSIIGNIFSPIMKIVPILDEHDAFKLHDFKVREFYNIPTSEISEIKIELRTHDGEFVNFIDGQHVVMNLQFTNELNPT